MTILAFHHLCLFLQEVHENSKEQLSFCVPPFNHHSITEINTTTETLQHKMVIKEQWQQDSSMIIIPVKGKFVEYNTNFEREEYYRSKTDEPSSSDLHHTNVEKMKFFIETDFHHVQKFHRDNKCQMMRWDILTTVENTDFLKILELMDRKNFFDYNDQKNFMEAYNTSFPNKDQFPNSDNSVWNRKGDEAMGINSYKYFRQLFQSKVDIRFGIADGLHRSCLYMKCMNDLVHKYGNLTTAFQPRTIYRRQQLTDIQNKLSVLASLTLSIISNDFTHINQDRNPFYHSEVVQAAKQISSDVLISNKLTVELTCKDIICSFLVAYETNYNTKYLHEIIQTWMSKHKDLNKQKRWIEFAKFYRNTTLFQFMAGYDHLMRELETKPENTLSSPFNINAKVTKLQMIQEKVTRTLPLFDHVQEEMKLKFAKKTFGETFPYFETYTLNEYWIWADHEYKHLKPLREAFKLKETKSNTYYKVMTQWNKNEVFDENDNEIINGFESIQEELEEMNSAFQLDEHLKMKISRVHNLVSKIPESFVMIPFSKMLHNNEELKLFWLELMKSNQNIAYDSMIERKTEHLGHTDIGMMTVIALMLSNFIFSTYKPFDKISPYGTRKPLYYDLNITVMKNLIHQGNSVKNPLWRFKALFRDQLCAFMTYQFLKAYRIYGPNPDFLKNIQDEHGLYAFLFLSQLSMNDETERKHLFHRVQQKVIQLFETGPKFDRVTFVIQSIQNDNYINNTLEKIQSHNKPTMFGGLLLMYYKWMHDKCTSDILNEFQFNENVTNFMKTINVSESKPIFKNIEDSNFLGNEYSFDNFMTELTGTYNINTHCDTFFPGTMSEMYNVGKSMIILCTFILCIHPSLSSLIIISTNSLLLFYYVRWKSLL